MPTPFSLKTVISGLISKIDQASRGSKSKAPLNHNALVFDFGKKSVLIVHLDTAVTDKPQILNYSRVSLPDEASVLEKKEAIRAKLPTFDSKSPPDVRVTWEEGMVFRQVNLPDMPDSDLKKALSWELKEKYFLNDDESFIGSECAQTLDLAEGTKEKFLSVFYCDKKSAMEKINLITGLGLEVSCLVPSQAAQAQALGSSETDHDILLFDIGYANARILAVHQKKNMLSRTVVLGGQTLTEMMTASYMNNDQEIRLSLEESEKLKVAEGCENPQAPFIPLVRPYLEKIVTEIKRSVDFYDGQRFAKPISKIVFTGGGSCLKGLVGFMKSFLGLPVEQPNPEAFLSARMTDDQKASVRDQFPCFTASIGTACFEANSALNLLPQEIKFKDRGRTKKMSLRLAAFATLTVLGYLVATTAFELCVTRIKLHTASVETKEISRLLEYLATIQSQDLVIRSAIKNDISHPGLFKTLSRLTPLGVSLQELAFNRENNSLIITGSMNAAGTTNVKIIAQFITELQNTPFFKEVTLARTTKESESPGGETKKSKPQTLEFELHCITKGRL